MIQKIVLLFITALSIGIRANGQFPVIDSLKQVINKLGNKEQKLQTVHALMKFRNSLPGDTILVYSKIARQLAENSKEVKQLRWAIYYRLTGLLAKGISDSIITSIDNNPVLSFNKKEDAALFYKLQLLKANVLNRINERTKALELQLKLLSEAEDDNDLLSQAFILNYTGATYYNLNQLNNAKQFWLKGINIVQQQNQNDFREIETVLYSNLCMYYGAMVSLQPSPLITDSLLLYINKTIDYSRRNNVYWILASTLAMRGSFYGLKGAFEKAENDFKEGLAIRNKIGDPLYISNDLINLGQFYYYKKQYPQCIEVLQQVINLNAQNHIVEAKGQALALLSAAYKATGDYKSYSLYLEKYQLATDSSARVNTAEKIADIQTRYELQKKEALIAQQQLDLLKQNIVLVSGAILLLLVLAFVYYFFKRYKTRQQLYIKNALLQEKLQSEEAVKDAQETERKRIAAELHDNLGVQATAIIHNTSLLQVDEQTNKGIVINLQKTAKEMLVNLRETLWALKNTDVSAIDLWLRIINFTKQMSRNYDAMSFTVQGEPPAAKTLSSEKALHIILLLQEAINNAVKHANAASIVISSIANNDNWVIAVADNGKGFNPAQQIVNTETYGLKNMQQRASAGGFTCSIDSATDKGTTITLVI